MYTYVLEETVKKTRDKLMNGEDIAFNAIVSHITRKPPIKV